MNPGPAPVLGHLQLAVMLLTRLPAGNLAPNAPVPPLSGVVWAFPLVGALVGGMAALAGMLAQAAGLPPDISALLVVLACLIITGALHEDGLADLADGFGGGRDSERKLAIMRDSRIGSYGTLALIMVLSLRVLCLGHMAGANWPAATTALIAIESASRAGMAVMLRALPAARGDGMGHAAAGGSAMAVWVAVALGVGALLLGFDSIFAALSVGAAMAAAQFGLSWLALRQIGGQTGDVLGAGQQIGASAGWIAAVALI